MADSLTMQQKIDSLRDGFGPERGGTLPPSLLWALLIVIVGVAILFVFSAIRRQGRRRKPRDPAKLFGDALAFLDLEAAERRLLTRLARQRRLTNPTVLLLSPQLFDEVALAWLNERAGSPSEWEQAAIRALRARIFSPLERLVREPSAPG